MFAQTKYKTLFCTNHNRNLCKKELGAWSALVLKTKHQTLRNRKFVDQTNN